MINQNVIQLVINGEVVEEIKTHESGQVELIAYRYYNEGVLQRIDDTTIYHTYDAIQEPVIFNDMKEHKEYSSNLTTAGDYIYKKVNGILFCRLRGFKRYCIADKSMRIINEMRFTEFGNVINDL